MDRGQLADVLRTRREALQPEDVGLPRGQRRRTGGPTEQKLYRAAEDRDAASRIWAEAERLARVSFPAVPAAR